MRLREPFPTCIKLTTRYKIVSLSQSMLTPPKHSENHPSSLILFFLKDAGALLKDLPCNLHLNFKIQILEPIWWLCN